MLSFTRCMLFCFVCLLSLSSGAIAGESLSGREIMIRVDNVPDGDDRRMELTMELENRRGRKRIRSMVLLSKDYGKDVKSIFFFKEPSDVRGTGFLVWGYDDPSRDDDRWLYLPALKRSKRISGSSKNDYFMGSDLTYDDMGSRSVDEDIHKFLKNEKFEGSECWVVESVPKEKDSLYSKTVSWICRDNSIPVKRVFYDKRGRLLKVLTKRDIRKINGYWTAFTTLVENIQDKHKTLLQINKIKYNRGLRNSLFRISTVERGSIR